MKKSTVITITAALVLTSAAVFAQDTPSDKNANGMMDKSNMMGKGMMMHGMMMKMGGMMNNSMVATSDGGIVVFTGGKLTKYDKDLNVVKEVELKNNMEAMQKMMGEMMEKCSMMGKGIEKDKDNDDDAGNAVDHASHHQ